MFLISTRCGRVTPYGEKIWVITDSDKGSLRKGTELLPEPIWTYRKVSNIRRNKSQNLNASRLIL